MTNNLESTTILSNGLTDLAALLSAQATLTQGAQVSQTSTLYLNLRWYLVSQDRQLLSQSYVEHGIIQTLIDQPVDDAFRSGFEIKSAELSPEEIKDLEIYIEKNAIIETLKQACKWARLYGGGAILLITKQDPATPFELNSIKSFSDIEFKAVDMWELMYQFSENKDQQEAQIKNTPDGFYSFYGKSIHPSRVYKIKGKEAPSFIRPRLRGWGMSELERLIRSLNQYLKNQDLIFELLDEAKIDVFKIKGFNTALLNRDGTNRISQRVQNANLIKNFQNALTMDSEDDYEQKQVTFSGLAEILVQIRQGIAADLKMPVTKLFGISSAGFNSGEDDIENYNAMIESEIRSKSKGVVCDILLICCQKLFGFLPTDLQIEFNPLRLLSAKEEEEVKDKKFNRTINSFTSGLIGDEETKQAINQADLLPIKIDETLPSDGPKGSDFTTADDEV